MDIAESLQVLAGQVTQRRVDDGLATFRALAPALATVVRAPATARQAVPLLFDLGLDLSAAGRRDAAEEVFRHARRLADAHHVAGLSAATRNQLGILYLDSGRLDDAREALQAAIALRRPRAARLGDGSDEAVYLAGALCNLGHVAREQGARAEAEAHYAESLARLERCAAAGAAPDFVRSYADNARAGLEAARVPPVSLAVVGSATMEWGLVPPFDAPEFAWTRVLAAPSLHLGWNVNLTSSVHEALRPEAAIARALTAAEYTEAQTTLLAAQEPPPSCGPAPTPPGSNAR
jgi:tetratricopeptide (TPR) repeat protein